MGLNPAQWRGQARCASTVAVRLDGPQDLRRVLLLLPLLPQLLRLRVLHLDFTPSGCGADTVTAVGGTHQAFLSTLDTLLFQHLGRQATNQLVAAVSTGRELFPCAASSAG